MFVIFKGDANLDLHGRAGSMDIVAIKPSAIQCISQHDETTTVVEYLVGDTLRDIRVLATVVEVVKKVDAVCRAEAAEAALNAVTSGSYSKKDR